MLDAGAPDAARHQRRALRRRLDAHPDGAPAPRRHVPHASRTSRSTPTRSSRRAPRSRPAAVGLDHRGHRHGHARRGDDRGALAAAASAAPRRRKGPLARPVLLDVNPSTLSIQTAGGYTERLLDKNSPIPIERTRVFTTARDNQTRVEIDCCRGESRRYAENEPLGTLLLEDLPPKPRGDLKIEVCFRVDADGILHVRAADADSGAQQEARMQVIGAPHGGGRCVSTRARRAAVGAARDRAQGAAPRTRSSSSSADATLERRAGRVSQDRAHRASRSPSQRPHARGARDGDERVRASSPARTRRCVAAMPRRACSRPQRIEAAQGRRATVARRRPRHDAARRPVRPSATPTGRTPRAANAGAIADVVARPSSIIARPSSRCGAATSRARSCRSSSRSRLTRRRRFSEPRSPRSSRSPQDP